MPVEPMNAAEARAIDAITDITQGLERLPGLIADIPAADTLDALEALRVGALGKSGVVTGLLKTLGPMSPEERLDKGPPIQDLRESVTAALAERKAQLEQAALDAKLASEKVDMTLPADGDYTVSVTSFQPGEVGPYSLTAGLSMGTPRQAGVQGGPRVFAIMVGISDYGGYSSDLAYTADDAIKLAEDLRREGVLNPSSIVLTDADATVGGVRRAFAEVAAQAGPDDIFLFFFSGHGSQQSVSISGNELDGLTETIVLRDGQITDTEMAELFATLDTRLSLIVLDSCFSGGFARNVVNRPGVIGLFSSEEDLTSQVAVKFQAGGYLSHFLRSGLTGEANYDGDDLITAGELTTYLRRQFAAEVMDVQTQTMDGQRSYQHLVVERGGVQRGGFGLCRWTSPVSIKHRRNDLSAIDP